MQKGASLKIIVVSEDEGKKAVQMPEPQEGVEIFQTNSQRGTLQEIKKQKKVNLVIVDDRFLLKESANIPDMKIIEDIRLKNADVNIIVALGGKINNEVQKKMMDTGKSKGKGKIFFQAEPVNLEEILDEMIQNTFKEYCTLRKERDILVKKLVNQPSSNKEKTSSFKREIKSKNVKLIADLFVLSEHIERLPPKLEDKLIMENISNRNADVRHATCYAIGQCGKAKYYKLLFDRIKDPVEDVIVKQEAFKSLHRILHRLSFDSNVMDTKNILSNMMVRLKSEYEILEYEPLWEQLVFLEGEFYRTGVPTAPPRTIIETEESVAISFGSQTFMGVKSEYKDIYENGDIIRSDKTD